MKHAYPLRLIDEIRMTKRINPSWGGRTGNNVNGDIIWKIYQDLYQESLEHAVVVDCNNLREAAYDRVEKGNHAIDSEQYPDFRLPYPEMWFEYESDDPEGIIKRVGVLARDVLLSRYTNRIIQSHTIKKMDEQGHDKLYDLALFVKGVDTRTGKQHIIGPTFTLLIIADKDGVIQRSSYTCYSQKSSYRGDVETSVNGDHIVRMVTRPIDWTQKNKLAVAKIIPALMAIQFMNCRNITQEVKDPPQTINERHRRQHPPLVQYRVLRIDRRAGKASNAPQGDPQTHNALHVCRGHFKRYTADKPLLGKHTGTYWWESHARGNREHGEVIKDYRIEPKGDSDAIQEA